MCVWERGRGTCGEGFPNRNMVKGLGVPLSQPLEAEQKAEKHKELQRRMPFFQDARSLG